MTGDEIGGLRLDGGPYAGAELRADAFGRRLPNGFCVEATEGVARYELDIDAGGPYYRFSGWRARTPAEAEWELLRARAERAREAARALRAEGRIGVAALARARAEMVDLRVDLQQTRRRGK